MLSKCANPACLARFRYLHQGRVFNIEMGTSPSDSYNSHLRKIEHFWLCEHCAQTYMLVVENGVVAARPLPLEQSGGPVQDAARKNRDVAQRNPKTVDRNVRPTLRGETI